MKTSLRLPATFKAVEGVLVSLINGSIDEVVASDIKGKNLFARYYSWDFIGFVWWDTASVTWCMEIWKDHNYESTVQGNNLNDILAEAKVLG